MKVTIDFENKTISVDAEMSLGKLVSLLPSDAWKEFKLIQVERQVVVKETIVMPSVPVQEFWSPLYPNYPTVIPYIPPQPPWTVTCGSDNYTTNSVN